MPNKLMVIDTQANRNPAYRAYPWRNCDRYGIWGDEIEAIVRAVA
jgi:hypothetical protein